MRYALLTASLLALAACGGKDETAAEATPAATDTAVAAPATTAATATGDMTGRYEVKQSDGSVVIEDIKADGTYTDTKDGKVTEQGKWRADGAKMCFDPEGADPEMCFTSMAAGADGSFKTTGPDGKDTGMTVRKIGAVPAT